MNPKLIRLRPTLPGPTLPAWRDMTLVMLANCGVAIQNLVVSLGHTASPHYANGVALWGLFSLVGNGIGLLGLPLWSLLLKRGFGTPKLRNWLAFFAVFWVTGLVGGIVRSWLAWHFMPALLDEKSAVIFAVNVAIGTVVPALVIELAGAYYARQGARGRTRQQLAEALAASQTEVVASDDEIRRELAELLHGKVQSHLVAAWVKVGQARSAALEPAVMATRLDEAGRYIAGVSQEALAKANNLLAPAQGQLRPPFDEMLTRFQAMMPVRCVWEIAAGAEDRDVAPHIVILACRLVDESLLNVFRHAKASLTEVRVGIDPTGKLLIGVSDDGIGFEPASVTRGLGLSGLGHAIEEIGGQWTIHSAPNRGTSISMSLPTQLRAHEVRQ